MKTEQQTPVELAKRVVQDDIGSNDTLIKNPEVHIRFAQDSDAKSVAHLYNEAYLRSDYFADRFSVTDQKKFNVNWLKQAFKDPEDMYFVFTDENDELLGATVFAHDQDSSFGPLFTSDETQIDIHGRGKRIMDHFFKRVVPDIEASGAGIMTDFVLTPESKGLRLSLMKDLGMVATGIHPNALRHHLSGILRSEVSAVKYPHLSPKEVTILSPYSTIYNIERLQMPRILSPEVVDLKLPKPKTTNDHPDKEVTKQVSAHNLSEQYNALRDGWLPVEYNPDENVFLVAKYPKQRPELSFVEKEGIRANTSLVRYLGRTLFNSNRTDSNNH